MAKEKKKAAALPEGEESVAPKKSGKKRIIIILLLILFMLSGVGAGAYWWFFMRAPGVNPFASGNAAEETAKTEDVPAHEAKKGDAAKAPAQGNIDPQARVDQPSALPRSTGVVLPLPTVTVNLYENGGHRYLKLGMEVEAYKDISNAIKANQARIRDAVIMLLAGKTYAEIASPDGKVMLKAEVANRLNQILGDQRIIRVYFTDFVVQ